MFSELLKSLITFQTKQRNLFFHFIENLHFKFAFLNCLSNWYIKDSSSSRLYKSYLLHLLSRCHYAQGNIQQTILLYAVNVLPVMQLQFTNEHLYMNQQNKGYTHWHFLALITSLVYLWYPQLLYSQKPRNAYGATRVLALYYFFDSLIRGSHVFSTVFHMKNPSDYSSRIFWKRTLSSSIAHNYLQLSQIYLVRLLQTSSPVFFNFT